MALRHELGIIRSFVMYDDCSSVVFETALPFSILFYYDTISRTLLSEPPIEIIHGERGIAVLRKLSSHLILYSINRRIMHALCLDR